MHNISDSGDRRLEVDEWEIGPRPILAHSGLKLSDEQLDQLRKTRFRARVTICPHARSVLDIELSSSSATA